MNKKQLAARLARQSHRSRGEAADSVDELVYGLLKDLRATGSKEAKAIVLPTAKALPAPKEASSATTSSADKQKEKI